MSNASYQPSQHKLDTWNKNTINEGIEIIGLAEANSNWIKFPKKGIYIIGRMDG